MTEQVGHCVGVIVDVLGDVDAVAADTDGVAESDDDVATDVVALDAGAAALIDVFFCSNACESYFVALNSS